MEGWISQEAQQCAQLHGRGLSSFNQLLPLLITLQLLAEQIGATDHACLIVSASALGTGSCCPHQKAPYYLTLQVHTLDAVPGLGLCLASSRLRSGIRLCGVPSDALLPAQANSSQGVALPSPPHPATASVLPHHVLGEGSSRPRCAMLLFACRTRGLSLGAAGGSPCPRAAFPVASLGLCPRHPLPESPRGASAAFSRPWVMAKKFGQGRVTQPERSPLHPSTCFFVADPSLAHLPSAFPLRSHSCATPLP